ncbi:ribosome maturation factor RimP [Actinomadura sp. K4S16]|uniref:ribosome maturation factor RimP n=1 Tax=Actinomadura sp. K4S16 TaxID=1316147 RepID=UPI0011EFC275
MSVESRGGRAQGRRGRSDEAAPAREGARPVRDTARPGRDAAAAALTRLLAPAVTEAGYDLEEVDVRPAGRRRLVRVVVDADGGISLDDIARLSETTSELLDGSDVMGSSPYVLEVTSPGVDRPLTEPRHWRRAVGRLVVAPLTEGGQIEGRVVAADDEAVEIDVVRKRRGKGAGAGGGKSAGPETVRRRFGLGELGRGRVQVEFKPSSPAEETRSPAEPD